MAKSKDYRERFYRKWIDPGNLITREIIAGETDIFVSARKDVSAAAEALTREYRDQISGYIKKHPDFKNSLEPLMIDPGAGDIIKEMIRTSLLAGVGPMASVAGAIAEFVGKGLLEHTEEVIIENGGDIFMKSGIKRRVAVYAGESPLNNKIFLEIKPEDTPLGICASSGTVGHSLSFGKADACVIISPSAALADAVATATCNRVKSSGDIKEALKLALSIKDIKGALIIYGKDLGVLGDITLK
ncbi:MAG TPA: UPF0280 family protein [Candidatus Omnitrophica bacterium]|nr:UPF0280 family protein [Candidatus Omnitrophota bacterium]